MYPIFITFLTFKDHGRIRRNNSAPAKILLLPLLYTLDAKVTCYGKKLRDTYKIEPFVLRLLKV